MFPTGLLSIYLAVITGKLEDMTVDMYFSMPIIGGFMIMFSQKIINGNLKVLGNLFSHIEKQSTHM